MKINKIKTTKHIDECLQTHTSRWTQMNRHILTRLNTLPRLYEFPFLVFFIYLFFLDSFIFVISMAFIFHRNSSYSLEHLSRIFFSICTQKIKHKMNSRCDIDTSALKVVFGLHFLDTNPVAKSPSTESVFEATVDSLKWTQMNLS